MKNRLSCLATATLFTLTVAHFASSQDLLYGVDITVDTVYVCVSADAKGGPVLIPLAADFSTPGGFRDEDLLAFRAANTSDTWDEVGIDAGCVVLAISGGKDEDLLSFGAVWSIFGGGRDIGLGSSTEDVWGKILSGNSVEVDPLRFLAAYHPGGGNGQDIDAFDLLASERKGGGNDVLIGGADEDLLVFVDGGGNVITVGASENDAALVDGGCPISCGGDQSCTEKAIESDIDGRGPPGENQRG